MMDSQIPDKAHLLPPQQKSQTIIIDGNGNGNGTGDGDELTSQSYSSYKSAMSTLTSSTFNHPLAISGESDILDYNHGSKFSSVDDDVDSSPVSSNDCSKLLSDHNDTVDVDFSLESYNHGSKDGSPVFVQPVYHNSGYLKISVSDPKKEGESGTKNSYVTYLITTETDIPNYNGSKFSVRRRFKDVVTLSDRLSDVYRGLFIPPRPDKSVVESQVMQKHEFVEQRRLALERYLRRLAGHGVIRKSEELRVFLQVEGKMPLLGRETRIGGDDVLEKSKSGRDFMRMFKELKQTVAMDWGGARPTVDEEDKEFIEKKEKLNQLELQLTNASKQAESLVKAQQGMAETLGELGLAFMKLTKFENEHATSVTQRNRATDMKSIATAAVKAGRLYRGLNTQSVKHLDTLHEYMWLMLAARGAFSDRSSALLTAQTLISELSSLHAKAEKLEPASSKIFGSDKSRPRKVEELKEAIRVTEDAKCCALKEYERIKENNRNEIERLDKERKDDFVNMLKEFVTSQVAYAEKIGTEWSKVAEETTRYAKGSE